MPGVNSRHPDRSAVAVTPLALGTVRLPPAHPRAATDDRCAIGAFVIHHPDGVILVDTGVADDHDRLNELYRPDVVRVTDALHRAGVDEREVTAIVNTHLHFDHCGQNRAFPSVPVWVQAAEYAMVDEPRFTIPEWARLDDARRRLVEGDVALADGVTLVATPGHTPGHQSVLVEHDGTRTVIVGQCTYTCREFEAGAPFEGDMHAPDLIETGRGSVARLRALVPDLAYFSHDTTVFRKPG